MKLRKVGFAAPWVVVILMVTLIAAGMKMPALAQDAITLERPPKTADAAAENKTDSQSDLNTETPALQTQEEPPTEKPKEPTVELAPTTANGSLTTVASVADPARDAWLLSAPTGDNCTTYPSTDVPVEIPENTATITSVLNVPDNVIISDVNVLNLNGTHSLIDDLDFNLTSPAATTVQIMARSCGSADDFNLNLDDEAAPGLWPCPPIGGGTYQPSNPLSAFDGQNSSGTWTLTINDNFPSEDGGSLDGWSLQICGDPPPPQIAVNPAQLQNTQAPDVQANLQLTIGNTGGQDLNWTIAGGNQQGAAGTTITAQDAQPLSNIATVTMPPVDNAALRAEDLLSAGPGVAPRFAVSLPVDITPDSHGTWETLADGTLVWRLRVQSPGALSLNLGFTEYDMPPGGSLRFYTPDQQIVRGPFTAADNEVHGQFWSPIMLVRLSPTHMTEVWSKR